MRTGTGVFLCTYITCRISSAIVEQFWCRGYYCHCLHLHKEAFRGSGSIEAALRFTPAALPQLWKEMSHGTVRRQLFPWTLPRSAHVYPQVELFCAAQPHIITSQLPWDKVAGKLEEMLPGKSAGSEQDSDFQGTFADEWLPSPMWSLSLSDARVVLKFGWCLSSDCKAAAPCTSTRTTAVSRSSPSSSYCTCCAALRSSRP